MRSVGVVTNGYVACSPSPGATVTVTPASAASSARPASRKGGIIFPSVKNKPIIGNNTFASEIVANYKDVKVSFSYIKYIITHYKTPFVVVESIVGKIVINIGRSE